VAGFTRDAHMDNRAADVSISAGPRATAATQRHRLQQIGHIHPEFALPSGIHDVIHWPLAP